MNVGWWRLSGCRYALCILSCEWSDWGNGFWWGITNKWCWLTVFDWTLKWHLKADSVFRLNNRHSVVDPQCSTTLQHQFCFTVFIFFYCMRFSHSLVLYYTLFERCAWQWWCYLIFFFNMSVRRRWWHPSPVLDGGAWWAAAHGVAKSQTRLSDFSLTFHFQALEKEMATHSSVLAWRIPGTGKPGGLPSVGSHRVGHDWSDLAAAALGTYVF